MVEGWLDGCRAGELADHADHLARLDGWETAVQLRRTPQTAHIKVVLITARAQEDDVAHGANVGAHAYLTKPFDPGEMIRVVRELAGAAPV